MTNTLETKIDTIKSTGNVEKLFAGCSKREMKMYAKALRGQLAKAKSMTENRQAEIFASLDYLDART